VSAYHSKESYENNMISNLITKVKESKCCKSGKDVRKHQENEAFLKQPSFFSQEKSIVLESSAHILFISEEESLHDLGPNDLQLISSMKLPLLNIIVAVYRDNKELVAILNKATGINGYIGKYWTVFFPLLIIQTCSDPDDQCKPLHEMDSQLIKSKFSSCHRLVVDSSGDDEFLMESIVRYHLHVTQCTEIIH
jgi:hypothetical protein